MTRTQRAVLEAAAADRVCISPTEQVWRIVGGPVVRPATIHALEREMLAVGYRGRLHVLPAGRVLLGLEVSHDVA